MDFSRKNKLYIFTILSALLLFAVLPWLDGAAAKNLWWTGLLLIGAMVTGFVTQPKAKELFPTNDSAESLKDHELLMGYYPVAMVGVLFGSLLLSPLVYGEEIITHVTSNAFWWAAGATGITNVFQFYLLNKGLRHGDISLVGATISLVPIVSLPISYVVFVLWGTRLGLPSPYVSYWGLIGITLTIVALAANSLLNKKSNRSAHQPAGDFLGRHPVLCGVLSTVVAGFSLNFDKIAVEAGNPFLLGVTSLLVVSIITFLWTLWRGGASRIAVVVKTYGGRFLQYGALYAVVVLVMNIALYGHNVNYYASIKRSSVLFATLYGVYVLREGGTTREKIVRLVVSVVVIVGIILMSIRG